MQTKDTFGRLCNLPCSNIHSAGGTYVWTVTPMAPLPGSPWKESNKVFHFICEIINHYSICFIHQTTNLNLVDIPRFSMVEHGMCTLWFHQVHTLLGTCRTQNCTTMSHSQLNCCKTHLQKTMQYRQCLPIANKSDNSRGYWEKQWHIVCLLIEIVMPNISLYRKQWKILNCCIVW